MDCTILLPLGQFSPDACRSVAEACRAMTRAERSYEALCLVAAGNESVPAISALAAEIPGVRCLQIDPPAGLSAALTAGFAAARGDVVFAWEPSGPYPFAHWEAFEQRLARADLACGRRARTRFGRFASTMRQIPRRLLLGLETRDPDCLFWAARREAVAGLELLPGMHRFLGSLVSSRGYRVAEVEVVSRPGVRGPRWSDAGPSLGNLLAAWWQRRRARPYRVRELSLASERSNRMAA